MLLNLPITQEIVSDIIPMDEIAEQDKIMVESLDEKKLDEQHEAVLQNVSRTIYSSMCIERELEKIIEKFLFPEQDDEQDRRRTFFRNHMIQSSSFDYAFKINAVEQILVQTENCEPKIRDKFIKSLHAIRKIRNRFAHGKIQYKCDGPPELCYHENKPKRDVMNDEYLKSLQDGFWKAWFMIDKIKRLICG